MLRFIPTRVGNTGKRLRRTRPVTVHPHACGEHSCTRPQLVMRRGSSPRVWGTLVAGNYWHDKFRFIPTRVGNTFSWPVKLLTTSVHPHACGEHNDSDTCGRSLIGSSPRVWGTRDYCGCVDRAAPVHPHACGEHIAAVVQVLFDLRFIPTRVGNTPPRPAPPMRVTVHPHACGEHANSIDGDQESIGSSPRVWGTHFL